MNTKKKIKNGHPEEILNEKSLKHYGNNPYRLAKETNIPATRAGDVARKKRGISADTVLRFSQFFGNSVKFWMGIQDENEVRELREKLDKELIGISHLLTGGISLILLASTSHLGSGSKTAPN